MNEQDAIKSVLAGDTEAFATLVGDHQARIRLICLVYLGNPDDADDAAQEIFLKAFNALPRFRKGSTFATWIARIADNHCRDRLRVRKRGRTESLDALLLEKGDAFEAFLMRALAEEEPPPYGRDELELLGKFFSALADENREILTLRETEELSYEEIAHRLHCTLDAVKGRLKRARQRLIEKCGPFFSDTSSLGQRLKK